MRFGVVSTAGLGLRTRAGRLVDSRGRTTAPVWALGALLRGDLWESTAIPEIRMQAHALATAVLDRLDAVGGPDQWPTDPRRSTSVVTRCQTIDVKTMTHAASATHAITEPMSPTIGR